MKKKKIILFQEIYGLLIYNYPIQVHRISEDDAGDFYIYCFENERIMKRVASFRGDNDTQFQTYLTYFVLKSLFLDWLRTRKEVNTVSLETPIKDAGNEINPKTLGETIPNLNQSPEVALDNFQEGRWLTKYIQSLPPEKRVFLKLQALGEIDLSIEDIREIAKLSGRAIRDTLIKIERAHEDLAKQNQKVQKEYDQITIISYRIRELEKEIYRLDGKIKSARHINDKVLVQTRTREKLELEKKLNWRRQQHNKLANKIRSATSGLPYRIIADILNRPVGSISSGIARLREKLQLELLGQENG